MTKRSLDRIIGKGNWGEPKWGFGNSPESKMSYYDRTGWLPRGKTVGEYWDNAVKINADSIAYVDTVEGEELSVTYQEADEMVKSLALSFIDMGIKPGDKITTVFQNSVRYAIAISAINYIGAVWVPLHAFLREAEWLYILKHSDVKILICDEMHRDFSLAKLADKLEPKMELLEKVIVYGKPESGQLSYNEVVGSNNLREKYPGNYINDIYLKENLFTSDDLLEMIYTSGTTGPPKGAMHTHDSNLQQALHSIYHYDLGRDDSLLNLAIMSHQHGYAILWQPFYICGLPVYYIGDFNPEYALKAIDKYKPTFVGLSPPIVTILANHPDIDKIDTSSVKAFVSAGASLPMTTALLIKKKMKNPNFCTINAYGMSECNAAGMTSFGDFASAEISSKSVGIPPIGCQAKVVATDNREKILPVDQQGEIASRGGVVGNGYYKNPEGTHQELDSKGWMFSGDLGKMDKNGILSITGRAKDIIVRGGNVVQPLFVEEFLRKHPDIADVSVIGIPDGKMVETGCAIIVPKNKERVFTLKEIYAFMKDKTMRDNIPDRVETWNELIYTATGKQIKYKIKSKVLDNIKKEATV